MKIKEVFIQHYGMLRPFHAKFDKNVCIIFGPGGAGKTLMIDGILKMLLGSNAWAFVRHKEVDETPTGYVVIEKDGKEYKLEAAGKHLSDIPGLELDPTELKDIFVIEDADLEISDEDKFYGRVTSKLIGVRTDDIRKIKDALRLRGRLTPKLEIINKHPHKTGEKLSSAKELEESIQDYLGGARSDGVDKLEKEKFDLTWDLKKLDESIELLEKAKIKSEFDNLKASLTKAKDNLQALKELPDRIRISQLSGKLLEIRKEKEKSPQLEREANSWKQRFKYLVTATSISFIALVIANFQLAAAILPFTLFLTSMLALHKWHQCEKSLARVETLRQSLIVEANDLRIVADTAEDVGGEIKTISEKIEGAESSFNQEKGILGKDLHISESDPEKFMEKAQNALTEQESSVDFDVSAIYNEDELRRAQNEKRVKSKRLEEVEKKLQEHQKKLQGFSEEALRLQFADEFSNFRLDFDIKNLDSLGKLTEWLNQYVEQIERGAELSTEAHEIFEELEAEEEAKSEELFGKDSQASKIFKGITTGMFEEVNYDSSAGQIMVKRSHDKKVQRASELSRSEWSQLYMAIRVALGERLLKGEEGFFIVEEPFIHADPERLLKEFKILKNLSKRGWQTIYLTAKEEIKEGLPKKIDVDLIELERLP